MSPSARSSLFGGPANTSRHRIRCLVPDLPRAAELAPYLERIDRERWYSNFGPLLAEYEDRLGDLTGAACVTLASGTAALELGITALGLAPGSRVLMPAFAFPAPLLAAFRCGLKPVLCDVDPGTWTLTPDIALAAAEEHGCRLVVPVGALGLPLPADAWDRFVQATGVAVLIDAAGALGLQRVGKRAGVAFSLHATKPLGVGEGGVYATQDAGLAERVRRLSNYGFEGGVARHGGATNAKLSEYAAAVGLAQLERRPVLLERRTLLWREYSAALKQVPGVQVQAGLDDVPPALVGVTLPVPVAHAAEALAAGGIEARRWYQPPLHHHPQFRDVECVGATLSATEHLALHQLGLPFHTRLSSEDISSIARAIRACVAP